MQGKTKLALRIPDALRIGFYIPEPRAPEILDGMPGRLTS